MNRVMTTASIAIALCAAFPSISRSGPVPYTGPWTAVFNRSQDDLGSAKSAFGAASTVHGQVTGQLLDVAVAKAEAVENGIGADSASVSFMRPFTLAPGFIYKLTLTVTLTGDLSIANASNDSAQVNAVASINTAMGGPIVAVTVADNPALSSQIPPGLSAAVATGAVTDMTPGFTVGPGNYEVRGLLGVVVSSTEDDVRGAEAQSLFFSTFDVYGDVEAIAIPEPSSLVLGSLALASLGGCVVARCRLRPRSAA
jgi:hypothetical protein